MQAIDSACSFMLCQFYENKMRLYLTFIICLFFVCRSVALLVGDKSKDYNALQLIRSAGYPAEAHVVETPDGYFLEIHRIPRGKSSEPPVQKNKCPVFMQHGLLGSSTDFLVAGPNRALAFLLADLGYDVWLGNTRGNTYSRAHRTLSPEDVTFWNFTWHEAGVYDLTTEIDFVRNYTQHEKVAYVGYSMGTTMFFVLTSTIPEFNEKIELSLLMAPVAYLKYVESPVVRVLSPISDRIENFLDLVNHGEFLRESKLLQFIGETFCQQTKIETKLCMNALFLLVGSDPEEFDKDMLEILINLYPAGFSAKGVNHYAQLVKSGKFRQYDYGYVGNMLHYGSTAPPIYNLAKIKTPMYFYQGRNDLLSSLQDVKHLARQLPTLRNARLVDFPKFSHLDFIISIDVKKLLYNQMIKDLNSFLNN